MKKYIGRFWAALLFFAAIGFASAASATIGKVLDVRRAAFLSSNWQEVRISRGMDVNQGNVIRTGASAVVQLVFKDGTRIAVGSKSRLVVDRELMRGNRARDFTVGAVSGSFRVISGQSASSVYSVRTPTAIMGVRGTAFDIHVARERTTMVTLEGIVRMCSGGACADGVEGCQPLLSLSGGGVGTPGSPRGVANALRSGFPFIAFQSGLAPDFRLDLSACVLPLKQGRTRLSGVPEDSRDGNQPRAERSPRRAAESPEPARRRHRLPFRPRNLSRHPRRHPRWRRNPSPNRNRKQR